MNQQLEVLDDIKAIKKRPSSLYNNIQRSILRYPGGKTWFLPVFKRWLTSKSCSESILLEPFAGGAISALTAVLDGFVSSAILAEKDEDVAAVWQTVFSRYNKWLADAILNFELTEDNILLQSEKSLISKRERALNTIIRNRINRGGIISPTGGRLNKGEKDKGINSRWYPETLHDRINNIIPFAKQFSVINGDGIRLIKKYAFDKNVLAFIDPPYIDAGLRLYSHSKLDHKKLFEAVSSMNGHFLMTYDNHDTVLKLCEEFKLPYTTVVMKNTHHKTKTEIIISNSLDWFNS